MALTEKQKRFVEEYLVDLNATQAAIRAGYKDSNIGRQLITKNNVSEAIQKAMADRSKRTEITADRVLQELAAIGFARPVDFVHIRNERVYIDNTDDLTNSQKAAIAGIKEGKHGIEIRMHDKVRALEKLGEHLGMFTGKGAQQENTPDDGFVSALKEDAEEVWQEE